jgi:hypothetical protein
VGGDRGQDGNDHVKWPTVIMPTRRRNRLGDRVAAEVGACEDGPDPGLFLPPGVIWLDTASGSRYRIDPVAVIWDRESHDGRSGAVRSPCGIMLGLLEEPATGRPAVIIGPPYLPGLGARLIQTTIVVRVWNVSPPVPHQAIPGWCDEPGAES